MNRFSKLAALAGVSLTVVATCLPAEAADLSLYAPERYSGDKNDLEKHFWGVFADQALPGVTMDVWNGTRNERISQIAVPDDERYIVVKRRTRKFAGELGRIGKFIADIDTAASTSPDRLDLLGVLRSIGDNRLRRETPLHVLALGSPDQYLAEPDWSMRDETGVLRVPSDRALSAPDSKSPYGTAGRKGSLNNVYIHVCVTDEGNRNSFESISLRRAWAHWTELQGGSLVTWSGDLSVCFERFQAEVADAIKVEPLNNTGPLGMVDVDTVAQQTANAEQAQPDIYSIFHKVDHPTVDGLIVYTGVEYMREDFPDRYSNSWCYFNSAANAGSVQVRIDVGDRYPETGIIWNDVSDDALKAAGITKGDLEAAKAACRFPEDDGT